jgi:hypothetical protein
MAITKEARRKIFSLVQSSKDLLVKEVESQLEQYFGIHTNGSVVDADLLTSKDADKIYTARILRQRLKYIQANQLSGDKSIKDAIRLLISEEAFTILNRFASLRMAEERNIVRESVRKAYNSEGFLVFDSITGQGQVTDIYTRYTWYLNAVFDELSIDLPALFDRFSPFALVFPSEQALIRLLDVLNNEEITIYREEGLQPVNLWKEDETIGWIYQYYNSKEEIKEMREASDLPRNSRELAVRNQFFTPRYVVQFLTDNSLGRIWYEMTQGQTKLVQLCTYLIHRNGEVFLQKGQTKPENAESEIQYIDFRTIKDPREIKMLDPACGSMHFGLYSFDIFEQIYIEAWDKYPSLFSDLRDKYTRAEFIAQVPVLIIRHNIHGVDIDPRALQIAGLSLWLRAQKSFDKLGLQAKDRPTITRANLVLAEPMPGNERLLNSLLKPLDLPMQQLVRAIWDKMLLAGETGLLLKIEQEITAEIAKITKEWAAFAKQVQAQLGDTPEQIEKAKQAVKYSESDYWQNFFDTAEQQVLDILKQLADEATNGEAYQTLLFAEDAQRGFAFIELCQQQYDVVLMNPPFGSASKNTESYLQLNYSSWGKNILSAFFDRMLELINQAGFVGAIFDRTVAIKSSYETFRKHNLCGRITAMADTGWNVLDANVETTTMVLKKTKSDFVGVFIDIQESIDKSNDLHNYIEIVKHSLSDSHISFKNSWNFEMLPNSIIGYYLQDYLINIFSTLINLEKNGFSARKGNDFVSFEHFRNYWESSSYKTITHLYNGGSYSTFYLPYKELVKSNYPEEYYKHFKSITLRNSQFQFQKGIGVGKFGDMIDAHVLKEGFMFTNEGQAITNITSENSIVLNGFLNSIFVQFVLNQYSGLHKQVGYLNLLPFPKLENSDSENIGRLVCQILNLKRDCFSLDETCLEFHHLIHHFTKYNSLKEGISQLQQKLISDKHQYLSLVKKNDDFWLQKAKIPAEALPVFEAYKSKRPNENLISIDGINDDTIENNPNMAYEIISNLLGFAYGRWDIRSVQDPDLIPLFGDFFDALPFMPEVSLKEIPSDYPVDVPIDGISVSDPKHYRDIYQSVTKIIYLLWPDNGDKIINELCEIGGFNKLEDFLDSPTGFFDFHYKRYTKSRREAPIYLPISTPSGSYTIWLYYPAINDQTLYSVVNNYLKDKIKDTETEISLLENNATLDNKGLKLLKELTDFKFELLDLEKEILRVAQLPYFPNHGDGVLITASPLHKLFRHSRWHKSTEDCWKALEKGEYDWAHLAYSIWPARVKTKCKKDLSMAIAHGLEDICEIKPKEKQAKKVTEPKEKKHKQPKLDL